MKYVTMGIAILLVLALAAAILSGCSESPLESGGEISDYDSQAFIPIGGNSQSGTESEANADSGESAGSTVSGNGAGTVSGAQTQSGGFLVSEKNYDFEGNNLVVLNVENQTDKNYSISIKGTYLDENGETLKEETITFEGFTAGWKNNFFFVPNIPFDRFTYTLEATEYTGECLAHLFTPVWKIEEAVDVEDPAENSAYWEALREWDAGGCVGEPPRPNPFHRGIRFYFGYRHEITRELDVSQDFLFLTSSGKVFRVEIANGGYARWFPGEPETNMNGEDLVVFSDDDAKREWPEEYKNATVLVSIRWVSDPLPINDPFH